MRRGLEDKEENNFAAKIELEWKLENEREIQLENKVPTISHIPRLFNMVGPNRQKSLALSID